MAELVAWINAPGELHPVLVSGVAQFQSWLILLDAFGTAS